VQPDEPSAVLAWYNHPAPFSKAFIGLSFGIRANMVEFIGAYDSKYSLV